MHADGGPPAIIIQRDRGCAYLLNRRKMARARGYGGTDEALLNVLRFIRKIRRNQLTFFVTECRSCDMHAEKPDSGTDGDGFYPRT